MIHTPLRQNKQVHILKYSSVGLLSSNLATQKMETI